MTPRDRATPRAATGRGLDPLPVGLMLVGSLVYLTSGFGGLLQRDSALYVYAGQMVAEGAAPYEEVMNRAGPFAHILPGIAVWCGRLVGADDVLAVRVLFFGCAVASLPLLYLVARTAFGSRLAGTATVGAFLAFTGFGMSATAGPQGKTPLVAFLLCALLAMLNRRWAWAGVWTAVATLTWQPVFFAAAAGAAVGIAAEPGWARRAHAAARYAAGGIVTLLAMVAYFWAHGAVGTFVDAFYSANARYTIPSGAAEDLGETWANTVEGYGGLGAWVLIGGTASLLVLTVIALTPVAWRPRGRVALSILSAVQVGALGWTVWKDYDSWPDAFFLLPGAALGVGCLVAYAERLPIRNPLPLRGLVVVANLAVAASTVVALRQVEPLLADQRAATTAVVTRLPADAQIVSISAPHPLAIARRHNPSRYLQFTDGMIHHVREHWPGGLTGYVRWIGDQRFPALAIQWPNTNAWARPLLRSSYVRIGTAPGWVWYVHTDVDDDVRRGMQAALRRLR